MHTFPDFGRLLIRSIVGTAFVLHQLAATPPALAQVPSTTISAPVFHFEFISDADHDSRAVDINNRGDVVGTVAAPTQYWGQETLWPSHGTPVALQGFGGQVTTVNNAGRAAGFQQGPGQDSAVTWWQGQIQQLPLDGNFSAYALGISDNGTVVGSLVKQNYDFVPAEWVHGQLRPLPIPQGATGRALDVNCWGLIVGELSLGVPGVNHAYLWMRHHAIDLHPAGYASSTAWAVNSIGVAAGWAVKGSSEHAGIWIGRQFVDLSNNAYRSLAYDINNAGLVVGDASITHDDGNTAVLWDRRYRDAPIDLNAYLPGDVAAAGWRLIWAKAINDAGVIVGDAYQGSTSRTRAFRLTPVHAE